jgi:hypothetical protein
MRRLQRNIRDQNIFWWVDSFMRAATDKELRDFPVQEEYIPEHYENDASRWGGQATPSSSY